MTGITLNGKKISVEDGVTILEAAEKERVRIPTLCYLKETGIITSCYVCLVEVEGKRSLVPACSARIEDGMVVYTDNERGKKARKAAIELLLSDHNGDCEGPCRLGCPANIESPKFINEILNGKFEDAIRTIKKSVAMPAVLGRICPEICEKNCRRAKVDEPVAICHLRRYVADKDLAEKFPYHPDIKEPKGKKIAVIGSGPAGLSCAYYLRPEGIEVTVFEEQGKLGGNLRYGVSRERLPDAVLDSEIKIIADLGIRFEYGKRLGRELHLKDLLLKFDAVFLAAGGKQADLESLRAEGVEIGKSGVVIDRETHMTSLPGVFAGGDCVLKSGQAVRSMAAGRTAAKSIAGWLWEGKPYAEKKLFSVRMGHLGEPELAIMMKGYNDEKRLLESIVDGKNLRENPGEARPNFTDREALMESARCLRCDCRKLTGCRLKNLSEEYGADRLKFDGEKRKFEQDMSHPLVVYQPGKCISCGICVKMTEKYKDELGLTFVGRGFNIKVSVPFSGKMKEILKFAAHEVADRCPTAAIAIDEQIERKSL